MAVYEYTFGVYVRAEDEAKAWEKVREISQRLDDIDIEGDSAVEGPTEIPETVRFLRDGDKPS